MSRRTLQLQQQRRMLRCVVEPSRELPERQNQAVRFKSPADQQRHASNQ